MIEGVLKKPISQIFEEDGAQGFREAETSVLNEVASYARFVVSTGGGIVASKENWGHLHNGIVVYLETPVECAARTPVLLLFLSSVGVLLFVPCGGGPGKAHRASRVLPAFTVVSPPPPCALPSPSAGS